MAYDYLRSFLKTQQKNKVSAEGRWQLRLMVRLPQKMYAPEDPVRQYEYYLVSVYVLL